MANMKAEEAGPAEVDLDNDYVAQLFNKIDWNSRIRPETHRDPHRWMKPSQYKETYMYKYLWYKLEPEQIDLTNPFDIEPGNSLRPKLGKRKKGREANKGNAEMNMLTEGLQEVKTADGQDAAKESDEDEDDFIDEYGNIKPKGLRTNIKVDAMGSSESEVESPAKKAARKPAAVGPSGPNEKQNVNKKQIRQRKNAKEIVWKNEFGRPPAASQGWVDHDSQTADIIKVNFWKKDDNKETESSTKFPRLSNLTYYDQENFLNMHARYMKGELYAQHEQQYFNLMELVQEERQEFMLFARETSAEDIPRYNFIHPDLEKYTTEHRSFRTKRTNQFPRYWSKVKEVRLSSAQKEQGDTEHFVIRPVETLLELGTIPKASIPNPKNVIQMPRSYSRIVNKYPPDPAVMPGTQGMNRGEARKMKTVDSKSAASMDDLGVKFPENKFINKTCITKDPNAQKLAVHYVPDVIISASALKCIMDNFLPKLDRSWDIPVVVQTFDQVVNGVVKDRKTVVFIGKPFLSKSVTAMDRNRLAYKNSLKTMLFHDWSTGQANSDSHKREARQVVDDDLFGGSDTLGIDDLETFGENTSTPKAEAPNELIKAGIEAFGEVVSTPMVAESGEPIKIPDHSELDENIIQTDGVVSPFQLDLDSLDGLALNESGEKVEDWFFDLVGEAQDPSSAVVPESAGRWTGDAGFTARGTRDDELTARGTRDDELTARGILQLDGALSSDSEDDLMIDLNQSQGSSVKPTQNEMKESEAGSDSSTGRSTRFRGQKRVPVFSTSGVVAQTSCGEIAKTPSGVGASTTRLPRDLKSPMAKVETPAPVKSAGVKQSTTQETKDLGGSSDSSSEEEMLESDELMLKKMNISVSSNKGKDEKKDVSSSSSSEEELEDDDFLEKKLNLSQLITPPDNLSQLTAPPPKDSEVGPLGAGEPEEEELVSAKFSLAGTKMAPSKDDLFGSGSDLESEEEEEDEDLRSPKKKIKALSSSESELDPEDRVLQQKLVSIGKEKAVISRVKRKIVVEQRLELLKTREADTSIVQKQERKTRASNRKSKDLAEINISNTAEAPALETPSKRPTRGCRKTPVSQPKEAEAPAPKRVTRKEAFKPLEEDLKVEPEKEKGDSFQEMLKQLKEDQSKRKVDEDESKPAKKAKKHKGEKWSFVKEPEKDGVGNSEVGTGMLKEESETITKEIAEINPKSSSNLPKPPGRTLKNILPKSEPQTEVKPPQPSGILDSLLSGQSELLVKEEGRKQEQPRMEYNGEQIRFAAGGLRVEDFVPPAPGGNVSYRLWNLWSKEKPSSNIRMIVRSKVAGFSPQFGPIVPSVKLEYQAGLGVDMSTVSQYAREWTDNVIRPGATTVRSRINPATGDICMLQPLGLKQLTEEGRQEQLSEDGRGLRFDPAVQLGNLHNLACELRTLPSGQYLLSHDQKSGPFCRLLQASGEGPGVLDLEQVYGDLSPAETMPILTDPWQPIDVNLVTPWHITYKRVPGTFDPSGKKPEPKSKNFGRGRGGFRGGRGRGGSQTGRGRGGNNEGRGRSNEGRGRGGQKEGRGGKKERRRRSIETSE